MNVDVVLWACVVSSGILALRSLYTLDHVKSKSAEEETAVRMFLLGFVGFCASVLALLYVKGQTEFANFLVLTGVLITLSAGTWHGTKKMIQSSEAKQHQKKQQEEVDHLARKWAKGGERFYLDGQK